MDGRKDRWRTRTNPLLPASLWNGERLLCRRQHSNEFPQEGVAKTYVWDRDGLFAGGLLDNPKLEGYNFDRYALGAESLSGTIHENPTTGEVLLFGHWVNEGRIFRITGWDGWERLSGALDLIAPAETAGNEVVASLFQKADGTRIGQWNASTPAFEPGQLKSQTAKQVAQSGKYLVRFSGQIAAPVDGEYALCARSGGNVHLVIGNYVAIDREKNHNASTPVILKANHRAPFQLEYSSNGEDEGVQLLWNRKGEASTRVPQSALFAVVDGLELPYGRGTGLTGKYYRAWLERGGLGAGEKLPNPSITRIDPVIDMRWNNKDERENSPLNNHQYVVHWIGFIASLSSGFHRIRTDPPNYGMVRFDNAAEPTAYAAWAWMEAGKKYPIEVYYNSFHHGHLAPREKHELRLQMAGPYHDFQTVPQSQLYPAG